MESMKLNWKLGRIIVVHPGSETKVRILTFKTGHDIIKTYSGTVSSSIKKQKTLNFFIPNILYFTYHFYAAY